MPLPFPVVAGAGRRSSPDFSEFELWSNFEIFAAEGKIEKIQASCIKIAFG